MKGVQRLKPKECLGCFLLAPLLKVSISGLMETHQLAKS